MKRTFNTSMSASKKRLFTLMVSAALVGPAVAGEGKGDQWKGEMMDAWIDGKVEASYALNQYLNPFDIDTRVSEGTVVLTGTVNSEIDRDLATEVAKSIDGVKTVENRLEIRGDEPSAVNEAWMSFKDDVNAATVAARVKYALIENDSTDGLSINVDVAGDTVTLSGEVASSQARELAARIASNAEGIEEVINKLEVISS